MLSAICMSSVQTITALIGPTLIPEKKCWDDSAKIMFNAKVF